MTESDWLLIDAEIVYTPGAGSGKYCLEDTETGMRATGSSYLEARRQLAEYIEAYDSYEEWLNAHGSIGERHGHYLSKVIGQIGELFGGSY